MKGLRLRLEAVQAEMYFHLLQEVVLPEVLRIQHQAGLHPAAIQPIQLRVLPAEAHPPVLSEAAAEAAEVLQADPLVVAAAAVEEAAVVADNRVN